MPPGARRRLRTLDVTSTVSANHRPSFRLSFLSDEADAPAPVVSEILGRARSAAPWDEASIYPAQGDFPRVHISWRSDAGFTVHCFEDERSDGEFLVSERALSLPSVEVNLGGQALERWPRELFVPTALATEALEYFLDRAKRKPSLFWTGTGDFSRETLSKGRK